LHKFEEFLKLVFLLLPKFHGKNLFMKQAILSVSLLFIFSTWALASANAPFEMIDCQYSAYSQENGELISARHFEAIPEQPFHLQYTAGVTLSLKLNRLKNSIEEQYAMSGRFEGRGFFRSEGLSGVFGNKSTFGFFSCEGVRISKYFFRTAQGETFTVPWKKGRNLRSMLTSPGTCIAGNLAEATQDLNSSFEFGSGDSLTYDSQKGLSWADVKLQCVKYEEPAPGEEPPPHPNCLEWKEETRTDYAIPPCLR